MRVLLVAPLAQLTLHLLTEVTDTTGSRAYMPKILVPNLLYYKHIICMLRTCRLWDPSLAQFDEPLFGASLPPRAAYASA